VAVVVEQPGLDAGNVRGQPESVLPLGGAAPIYLTRQARAQSTFIVAPRGGGGIPLANIW
jgi:hypothetical protein